MDLRGNTWVANRETVSGAINSVARFGLIIGGTRGTVDGSGNFQMDPNGDYLAPPFVYNTCVDKNHDGFIKTSRGLGHILPWGEDEAVDLVETETTGTRTVAIDRDNNVWIGGRDNGVYQRIDTSEYPFSAETVFTSSQNGAYGGLIDGSGVLWSVSRDLSKTSYRIERYNTITDSILTPLATPQVYGIGIDPVTGRIWYSTLPVGEGESGFIHSVSPNLSENISYYQGGEFARGLAVDGQGNVWVALHFEGVGHLRTDGTLVGKIALPCGVGDPIETRGIAIDSNGRVWAAASNGKIFRINPEGGPIGGGEHKLGFVDMIVDLDEGMEAFAPPHDAVSGPYNYSDMTGFVALGSTVPSGHWTAVHDGTEEELEWKVSWTKKSPTAGEVLKIEVRAAEEIADLYEQDFVPVASPSAEDPVPGVQGRYVQVQVTFVRGTGGVSPILYDLTVTPGSDILVDENPNTIAKDDEYSVSENAGNNLAYTLDVLENDTVPAASVLSLGVLGSAHNGIIFKAQEEGRDVVKYIPNKGFYGLDRFTYPVTDGAGTFDRGLVLIRVARDNPSVIPPQGTPDTFIVNGTLGRAATTKYFDVLANDVSYQPANPDPDNDGVPSYIETRLTPSGPDPDALPDDWERWVLLMIQYDGNPANDSIDTLAELTAAGDFDGDGITNLEEYEQGALLTSSVDDFGYVSGVLTAMEDGDGIPDYLNRYDSGLTPSIWEQERVDAHRHPDSMAIITVSTPLHGSASVIGCAPQRVTYTPHPGYAGLDEFTYTIVNSKGLTDVVKVSLTVKAPATIECGQSVAGAVAPIDALASAELDGWLGRADAFEFVGVKDQRLKLSQTSPGLEVRIISPKGTLIVPGEITSLPENGTNTILVISPPLGSEVSYTLGVKCTAVLEASIDSIALDPPTYFELGKADVAGNTLQKVFQIANKGQLRLDIDSITFDDPNFSLVGTLPISIDPEDPPAQSLSVLFAPPTTSGDQAYNTVMTIEYMDDETTGIQTINYHLSATFKDHQGSGVVWLERPFQNQKLLPLTARTLVADVSVQSGYSVNSVSFYSPAGSGTALPGTVSVVNGKYTLSWAGAKKPYASLPSSYAPDFKNAEPVTLRAKAVIQPSGGSPTTIESTDVTVDINDRIATVYPLTTSDARIAAGNFILRAVALTNTTVRVVKVQYWNVTTSPAQLIGETTVLTPNNTWDVVWQNAPPGDHKVRARLLAHADGDSSSQFWITDEDPEFMVYVGPPKVVNNPPIAQADAYTIWGNNSANGGWHQLPLRANDTDPDDDPIKIVWFPPMTSKGIITSDDDGLTLKYKPIARDFSEEFPGINLFRPPSDDPCSCLADLEIAGLFGTDHFHYKIDDGKGGQSEALVQVTVNYYDPATIEITEVGEDEPSSGEVTLAEHASSLVIYGTAEVPTGYAGLVTLQKVELYANGRKVGEQSVSGMEDDFAINWSPVRSGVHSIRARVIDSEGSIGLSPAIKVTNPKTVGDVSPVAVISTPREQLKANLSEKIDPASQSDIPIVNGLVTVNGRAYDTDSDDPEVKYQFALYQVDGTFVANLSPQPIDDEEVGVSASEDFPNQLDLTRYPDGVYELELSVWDNDDMTIDRTRIILRNQLKIGQFTFSQEDVTIPGSGLPLTVVRTYDSYNPKCGDFGYGWTYSLADLNVEIDEYREITSDYFETEESFSMRAGGGRNVTLTLPDGRRTTFIYDFVKVKYDGMLDAYEARWFAPADVTATLTSLNPGKPSYRDAAGNRVDGSPGDNTLYVLPGFGPFWAMDDPRVPLECYDIPGFKLTLEDGTVYEIRRDGGDSYGVLTEEGKGFFVNAYGKPQLRTITQPDGSKISINGDKITKTQNGRTVSTVLFVREQGRITQVYDATGLDANNTPTGVPVVQYFYDSATTNLTKVVRLVQRDDPGTPAINEEKTEMTRFIYGNPNFPHYITSIRDAREIEVGRTEYHSNPNEPANYGRVKSVIDADGISTTFDREGLALSGHSEYAVGAERITDHWGNETIHEYDARGNVVVSINPVGLVTTREYDDDNNRLIVEQQFASDGDTLVSRTDRSIYYHDPTVKRKVASDMTIRQKVVNGAVVWNAALLTVSEFDVFGQLVKSTDAMGNYTLNTYDPITRNLLTTRPFDSANNALQPATENNYHTSGDFKGLLNWSKDAGGNYTYHEYYLGTEIPFEGAMGQLKSIKQYEGNSAGTLLSKTIYTYDEAGNTLTEKRAKANESNLILTRNFYDAKGRLIKTIDPEDTRSEAQAGTRTGYNAIGKVEATTNLLGKATRYLYNSKGETVQTTHPDNSIILTATVYGYPVPGGQAAPNGQGRAVIATDRHIAGMTVFGTRTIYDEAGRAVRTERLKNVVIEIDPQGNTFASHFVSADTPLSYTETIYGESGRVDRVFDSLTQSTTIYGYDGWGRQETVTKWTPISATKQDRTITVTQFDDNGNVLGTEMTVAHFNRATPPVQQGATETISTPEFSYDKLNRRWLTKFTQDDGGTPKYTYARTMYDNLGRVEREIDQEGVATRFEYYASGKLKAVTKAFAVYDTTTLNNYASPEIDDDDLPEKARTIYRYDLAGNQIEQEDAEGRITTFGYDGLGRLRSRTLPTDTESETSTYNTLGQLWEREDLKGQITKFRYDSLGRLAYKFYFESGVTEPANSVAYEYDEMGRVERISERSGDKADMGYVAMRQSDEGMGAKLMATLGQVPKDTGGRLVAIPVLAIAWLLIPKARRREWMVCVRSTWRAPWTTAVASVRRRVRIIRLADLKSVEEGEPLWRRWWRCLRLIVALGETADSPVPRRLRLPAYGWRFATLITLVCLLGSDPAFEPLWNARAACTLPSNPTIPDERVTILDYDDEGRLEQMNSPEGVINYEYDPVSGRRTQTCSKNSRVGYGYDLAGRLETVTVYERNNVQLATPETTTYTYNSVGSRASVTLPNDTVTTYTYDDLNRLTDIEHWADTDTTLLASYHYELYDSGRRQSATEVLLNTDDSTETTSLFEWEYDRQYRLLLEEGTSSASALTYTMEYDYDLVGNRTQKVRGSTTIDYHYNAKDELTSEDQDVSGTVTTTTYGYDDNGSLTSKTVGGNTVTYAYNLANKLSSVTVGITTTSYLYNDSGIRVRSAVGGGSTTHYLVDGNNSTGYAQVLEELSTAGGTPSRSYVIGDDVLGQCGTTTSDPAWLLYDGHGSTRHLVRATTDVTAQYNYDAYGVSLTTLPSNPDTSLLYCGEQYDSTLDMYNLRARFYNPNNGRFNAMDTFMGSNQDPQSLHKYAYVHGDPINAIDPLGHRSILEFLFWAAIVLVVMIALVKGIPWNQKRSITSKAEAHMGKVQAAMLSVGFSDADFRNSDGPQNALAHQLSVIIAVRDLARFGEDAQTVLNRFQERETDRLWHEGPYNHSFHQSNLMDRENNASGAFYALRPGNPIDILAQATFVWIENGTIVRRKNPLTSDRRFWELRDLVPMEARAAPGDPDDPED